MLLFIDSEALIGNAFVASLEKSDKRFISWKKLCDFGNEIEKIYEKQDDELKLLFTKEYTKKFLEKYSTWFKEEKVNGEEGLVLVNSISLMNLRKEFRTLLNLDTIKVFNIAEDKIFGKK